MKQYQNQKGFLLYSIIIILSIILAIVLGLNAILITQIRIIEGMEDSVVAFYAADTGIERILKIIYFDKADPASTYSETLGNLASYEVTVVCPPSFSECPVSKDAKCSATKFCIRSVGSYKKTKRAIEARI